MKKIFKNWMWLLAIPILAIGCYPSPSLSTSDLDVIITTFDKQHDFGAGRVFTIADTVYVIETDNSIELTDEFDEQIKDLIRTNLTNRGYTYISPDSVENGGVVDFFMVAAKNGRRSTGTVVGGCYPGWGWYPPPGGWWGPGWGWCPPYVGTFTFDQGSIIVSMLDPDFSSGEDLSGPWFAATNGLLGTSSNVTSQRITDNINRMFVQSPYIQAN